MFAKIMFVHPKQHLTKRTGELLQQVPEGLNSIAPSGKKNALASACVQTAQVALRKADEFTKKIPVPAAVTKHFSKRDMAFIAAAYAIPLPGTALFAAALVGSKLGCRHLRNRWKPRLTADANNG